MDRRDFIGACAAGVAVGINPAQAATLRPRFYQRVRLLDATNRPLRAASLAANRNYIFHYPFAATPCFLLNLGKPTQQAVTLKTESGTDYDWPGGVGPQNAIVGYSAICAHQLSYPTRQISFISYRTAAGPSKITHTNVIHCCSEHSEYDPATGARVLGGPAPQPLSAILLEHDKAGDQIYAVGTLGAEMYDAFFKKYEFKLALEYGERARQPVAGTAIVTELNNYCRQQVQC
ncbi:MAG: Rieske-I iron sulfur protein-like protein [Betaproteobacteria bacterium]|nr:Rieske-I iron sulfur protein-like protein [Betaproteobacteria bacterium]